MLVVQTKLNSRIDLIKRRMHRATELSAHRPAEAHVAIYQQIAPRDTGLMADTTHKEPDDAVGNRAEVIAPQPYTGLVEFGTTKMPARPRFAESFAAAVALFRAGTPQMVDLVLKGGEPPIQTIGVVRGVSQRRAPTAGAVRKIRSV
jgi:hypothetical protein